MNRLFYTLAFLLFASISMKRIIFFLIVIISSQTLFGQVAGSGFPNWDGTFDVNDIIVDVDKANGILQVRYTSYYNNTGCQWALRDAGNVNVRESGGTFVSIAQSVDQGNTQWAFAPMSGVTMTHAETVVTLPIAPGATGPGTGVITTLRFTNLNKKYLQGVVDVQITGLYVRLCGGTFITNVSPSKVTNLGAIPSVSSPNTGNYCDRVRVNWSNPNSWTNRRTRVYRDGTQIFESPNHLFSAFDDFGATPGVAHNYEVQTLMYWNYSRVFEGPKISVSGTRSPTPQTPQNIYVDQVNCNGALEINWGWSATTNPSRFIIQRAPDNTFNPAQTTQFQTSGSDRSYRDLTTQVGTNYFWRVIAQDDCPAAPGGPGIVNGSWSDVIQQAGLGIPAAPSAISLAVDTIGKKVTVHWTDNSSMEDGFKVVRQSSTGQVEFDVAENATSYVDNSAQTCETYTYSIKSYNSCKTTGVLSTGPNGSTSAYIPTNLSAVFDGNNNKLEASDGEFGNRIELKWKTANRQVDFWNILRINPQTNDTTPIATVNGRNSFYSDVSANANTLYEYLIQGETDCAGNIVFSNTSSDNGFRLSFGTVNGQITYDGGVAVEGVKVSAEPASGSSGYSGNFSNGNASVATSAGLESDTMTISAFVKPSSLSGKNPIISKQTTNTTGTAPNFNYSLSGFAFYLDNANLVLSIDNSTFSATHGDIVAGNWFSVAATVHTDSIKLFVNGQKIHAQAKIASLSPLDTSANLVLGGMKNFVNASTLPTQLNYTGLMEEARFFDRALSDLQLERTTDIYINPSMEGLKGYWRFDAGFGGAAYDYSKTVVTPNKNHATLTNVSWSANKPTPTQIAAGAYTNELGSYFIPFIPYAGTGDNYILTPTFGVHQFSPATTTLLIGQGSTNYTGQDFTDISSFKVTGQVKYASTSCFVRDARILIDGEVVIKNGQVVQTDAQGQFDLQVPIGPHILTVEKTSHGFSAGRFPSTGTFDFQAPVSGIEFVDSTLIKVVGRVAGGGIQKDLPPALGLGKNNIGQTSVFFKAQQGNGCLVDTAITDALTGEYIINLPPMRYQMPNISPDSNFSIEFINNDLLDISVVPPLQFAEDSVFRDSLGIRQFVRVDSASYQRQRDFIYYSSPQVNVIGAKYPGLYGSDTLAFEDAGLSVSIPLDTNGTNPFGRPIFYENDEYRWVISAFEIYENRDGATSILDSVPMVEGKIIITNNLASQVGEEFEYTLSDSVKFNGLQAYNFAAGQANTALDAQDTTKNFTKTCEITLAPKDRAPVTWQPNNETFRGIIFGARALGNSFATSGPDVVTMILRDPPGTESSASWESNVTVTSVKSWENAGGIGLNLNKNVAIGTKFTVGLGYSTPTEIENSLKFNTKIETSVSSQGEYVEETSRSVALSTGGGDEFVGADADLFFGRAMNMDFGLSQVLNLVNVNDCNGNCFGAAIGHNGQNYKIGLTNSMFTIPQGYETEFVYTQGGIENQVIPRLEALRDQLLLSHPDYSSQLAASHDDFGKSNDNPSLTNPTPNPEDNSAIDSLGESYHFTGYRTVDTTYTDTVSAFPLVTRPVQMRLTLGVDSVWWYNKQIRLWEDAIAQNEKAKVTATTPQRNISYQGGSSISYTITSSRSESNTTSVSFNLGEEMTLKIGAKVGGAGVEVEQGVSMNYSHNTSVVDGESKSTTFSYTLSDPDGDDDFSVDVFEPADGFGPVFKTRGGQTSCPYQGETVTKYYQPGTILDKATIQLEQPRITASPANLFNVPANGTGNITLSLINDGLEDAVYGLKVLEPSNPDGAILRIDGIGPNRNFPVPAQTSISKILSIQKGPTAIEYDSIALVFHSLCQYAFGTANYEDIADTVYVSVNFLPSCTDIDLQAPQNQFVANNSFNNTLPVVISGYDINYGGLEKIQLQYKPSNQASWVPLPTQWFKDTVDLATRYPNHPDPKLMPRNQAYITYLLEMDQLIDQDYDLRAASTCQIPNNPEHTEFSSVISGVFDRINPHAFGSPTPADGVLDPNDDISIQFNEDIEGGSLTADNFQITGVLNGAGLRNDKAVNFDGATGYMEIANGFDFTSGDFTIEFWAKRSATGTEQYLISQGTGANNNFSIVFNSNNRLELRAGNFSTESSFAITDTANWHHYSIAYDRANLAVEFVDRFASNSISSVNNNFFHAYQSGGKTYVGRDAVTGANYFDGSMHELRIWSRYLSDAQISSRNGIRLNGREAGLIGCWPMDEGRGNLAQDIARFRNAEMKAEWELNPKSTAVALNGTNQYVSADSAGTLAMTQEMDLTLEFWFKTAGGRLQSMLSNGGGRFTPNDVNRNGWNIEMNAQNEIWVKNDSFAFRAVDHDFADNNWHHFALVVNRLANSTAYIDGVQQNATASTNFHGFSGAKMMLGARYSLNGTVETIDQHFNGNLDEVRVWNKALIRDNIELNMFNRLNGDEFGLQAYYPFEDYRLELGVPVLDPALSNESQLGNLPSRLNASANNGTLFSTESPAIALQRPVEKVNFSWSVNGDRIVITPNDPSARIENVTLNISVKDVKDLRGNSMQSPKTWIAFVNKNQVLWQDQQKNLTKEFNDTMTFSSRVVNSGGEVKNFTISNIPAWLTVSPSSGSIQPLSTQTIRFTVNQNINIGDYTQDLLLSTDFGFDEKLLVNLEVRKTAPDFSFNSSQYSKTMSVIGQISINDVISTNDEDILVAYSANQIRGEAQLQYVPSLDRYIAFMDIYSNTNGDSLQFKVWNAMSGELHEDVTPEITFTENALVGSLLSPQEFKAINKIAMPIALKAGWNWVSFPLHDEKLKSLTHFMNDVNFMDGDQVKTIGFNTISTYGSASGWTGQLSRDGLSNHRSYLIHSTNADTIGYTGLQIDPDTMPIQTVAGWNRIGFVSTKNIGINTALANYQATDGDLIKSQGDFAVYLSSLGWIGSLTALEPSKGYLLQSAVGDTFTYPRSSLFRMKGETSQKSLNGPLVDGKSLAPHAFESSSNLIIEVNTCQEIVQDTNWALAAFDGQELRGFADHSVQKQELDPAYYLTIFGEDQEEYKLMLFNKFTKEKLLLAETVDFVKDQVQGEAFNPLSIGLEIEQNCDRFKEAEPTSVSMSRSAYPNPFRNYLTVEVPEELSENSLVQISDQHGKILYEVQIGDQEELYLNGSQLYNFRSGVYHLKFIDGETVTTEKLVKIK